MPTGEAAPDTAVGVRPAGIPNSDIAAADYGQRRNADASGVGAAGSGSGSDFMAAQASDVVPLQPQLVEVFPLERHLSPEERGVVAETVGGAAHAAALTPFSRVVAHMTARQGLWLLVLQCLGAAVLDFAINLLIHWAVYNNDDPIHLWELPNSIAGDFAVTLIVQTILTWLIGGVVAYRDLWRRTVAPLAPPLRPLFLQRAASRDVVLVHPIALQKRSVNDPRRRPEQNATLLRLAAPPVRGGRVGPFARLLAWFLATPDVAHVHVTAVEPVGGPRARVHVSAHAQPSGSAAAGSGGSGYLGPPVDLSVHLPAPAEAVIAQAANNAAAAGYERSEGGAAGTTFTAGQMMPGVAAGSEPAALRARHRGEGATADEREPLSPPSAGMHQAGGTTAGAQSQSAQRTVQVQAAS